MKLETIICNPLSFWLKTIASDVEELTFIPDASHSAVNRSSTTEGQQNHIICKKQKCHPEVPKPDTLLSTTTPPDPVHEKYEQDR